MSYRGLSSACCRWRNITHTTTEHTTPARVAVSPLPRPTVSAWAAAWPVGEPGMAGAVGQAYDRHVAAEAEILGTRGRDRPAALLRAQLHQRAAGSGLDRLFVGRRQRFGVQRLQQLVLQPWHRPRAVTLGGSILSRRAPCLVALSARQVEPRELADDGVAAHPDVVGNFAARQPGFKAQFQQFDAFGSPGGFVGEHVDGPKLRVITPNPVAAPQGAP